MKGNTKESMKEDMKEDMRGRFTKEEVRGKTSFNFASFFLASTKFFFCIFFFDVSS